MPVFKKILCATDFSDASCQALATAVELAMGGHCGLSVIYVEPLPRSIAPVADLAPDADDEIDRHATAISQLNDLIVEHVPPTMDAWPIVKTGDAAEEIIRTAEQEDFDVIVLSTHGGRGWQPGVLGSVAARVISTAPCLVLSLSGHAGERLDGARDDIEERDEKTATAAAGSLRPAIRVVSSQGLYLDGD